MKRRPVLLLTLIILSAAATLLLLTRMAPVREVRGKTAARPLTGQLTTQQQRAQDIALSDGRVQAYTLGRRSEVMGIRELRQPAGANNT
ncbi:MAG TPA: hypothetical protein EYH05_01610, partial [Anaerolineae bacterium]|nr:hypothetical protein [Anaerolineae bacterium]